MTSKEISALTEVFAGMGVHEMHSTGENHRCARDFGYSFATAPPSPSGRCRPPGSMSPPRPHSRSARPVPGTDLKESAEAR